MNNINIWYLWIIFISATGNIVWLITSIVNNDWVPIWCTTGKWKIGCVFDGITKNNIVYCTYEILYSKKRNRYKLKCKGETPKENSKYIIAVNKLNELVNKNDAIQFKNKE